MIGRKEGLLYEVIHILFFFAQFFLSFYYNFYCLVCYYTK